MVVVGAPEPPFATTPEYRVYYSSIYDYNHCYAISYTDVTTGNFYTELFSYDIDKLINEIINDYEINNITLEVSVDNCVAIKLYEKLGFKSVALRKEYYNGTDAFLMLKEVR